MSAKNGDGWPFRSPGYQSSPQHRGPATSDPADAILDRDGVPAGPGAGGFGHAGRNPFRVDDLLLQRAQGRRWGANPGIRGAIPLGWWVAGRDARVSTDSGRVSLPDPASTVTIARRYAVQRPVADFGAGAQLIDSVNRIWWATRS